MRFASLLLVAALAALAAADPPTKRVLFVGNSLTYVNDLPGLCQKLFASPASVLRLTVAQSVQGGASFREHTVPGGTSEGLNTLAVIASAQWDYVVLQDQSGAWFQLEPPLLNEYGYPIYDNVTGAFTGKYNLYPGILVDAARRSGAMPVFFDTWRTQTDGETADLQAILTRAYSYVANLYHTQIAPCGDALVGLFGYVGAAMYLDDVHPALIAQYVNAATFYATLTGQSPVGLGDAGTGLGGSYNLTKLQEFAWTAYRAYKAAQQAQCNYSMCVRFVEADGSLSVLPTAPATTAPPPTTPFDVPYCGFQEDRDNLLSASNVLNSSAATQLSNFIRDLCPASWNVCYRAAGFHALASNFHYFCDNQGPTLTVIKAGGRVFGGFTPSNWTGANGASGSSLYAHNAFLFRVSARDGSVAVQYLDTPAHDTNMFYAATMCPMLGKQTDLNLGDCTTASFFPYDGYSVMSDGYNATWLTGAAIDTPLPVQNIEVFVFPRTAPTTTATTKAPSTTASTSTSSTTTTTTTAAAASTTAGTTGAATTPKGVATTTKPPAVVTTTTTTITTTTTTTTTTTIASGGSHSGASATNKGLKTGGIIIGAVCGLLGGVVAVLLYRRYTQNKGLSISAMGGYDNPSFGGTSASSSTGGGVRSGFQLFTDTDDDTQLLL